MAGGWGGSLMGPEKTMFLYVRKNVR